MGPRTRTGFLLMLVLSALLGACGDDSGPNGVPSSETTFPFDGEERCDADPTEIGCTAASAAPKGTSFEDTFISLTYRGARVVQSDVGPERSFGEPATRPGVEYHLYFELRASEMAGPRWGSFMEGTNLRVEEAPGSGTFLSAPGIRCCRLWTDPEAGKGIGDHGALVPDGRSATRCERCTERLRSQGEAFHRATFAIDGQGADDDAVSDVVASHDVVLQSNPGWGHDGSLARSSAEAAIDD